MSAEPAVADADGAAEVGALDPDARHPDADDDGADVDETDGAGSGTQPAKVAMAARARMPQAGLCHAARRVVGIRPPLSVVFRPYRRCPPPFRLRHGTATGSTGRPGAEGPAPE